MAGGATSEPWPLVLATDSRTEWARRSRGPVEKRSPEFFRHRENRGRCESEGDPDAKADEVVLPAMGSVKPVKREGIMHCRPKGSGAATAGASQTVRRPWNLLCLSSRYETRKVDPWLLLRQPNLPGAKPSLPARLGEAYLRLWFSRRSSRRWNSSLMTRW